ncbi:MAG: S8 family peptidase [Flavobacteriaceae bacterium]|nr:S8 family peptidase [Flavobacteriaceae bacterium]
MVSYSWYPIVGVLDSGIAKNTYLEDWLTAKSFSSYPDERIDRTHGTYVSSIILYGDDLESEGRTGNSGVKLFDATVFPDNEIETIYEDELIENIREAIKSNDNIEIWNLSLGTGIEAGLKEFSDFAIELDNIQKLYKVIICKSAGNCQNFKSGRTKGRITKSADSLRSLVVGSVAHKKNECDISEPLHPSPFSRIGPGPAGVIKPELVTIGGNAGINSGRTIINGVQAISPDGKITKTIGTSFSTPRVTALLSELNFRMALITLLWNRDRLE